MNFSIPEKHGILTPAVQYRFRVSVKPAVANDLYSDGSYVTQQVSSCDMDFVNNLVGLELRQPIIGPMQQIAILMCKEGLAELCLDSLDGSSGGKPVYTLVFKKLKAREHYSRYDYASDNPVIHGFKFRYESLEVEHKLVFKNPCYPTTGDVFVSGIKGNAS